MKKPTEVSLSPGLTEQLRSLGGQLNSKAMYCAAAILALKDKP